MHPAAKRIGGLAGELFGLVILRSGATKNLHTPRPEIFRPVGARHASPLPSDANVLRMTMVCAGLPATKGEFCRIIVSMPATPGRSKETRDGETSLPFSPHRRRSPSDRTRLREADSSALFRE